TISLSPVVYNYDAVIEVSGVSILSEKGFLWVAFSIDDTGAIVSNKLQAFGKFTLTKYILVRTDTNKYELFFRHDDFNAFFKFRPMFNFGGSSVHTYYQLPAKVDPLPAGSQYYFTEYGSNGQINQETKFLSGGFWVYSGTGLIFDTVRTECQFPGSNDIITIPGTRINLAAFPALDNDTDPQFVRPKWNSAGDVVP